MNLPRLWPGQEVGDPFLAMRREMENVFRAFDQKPSSTGIGAGAPATLSWCRRNRFSA